VRLIDSGCGGARYSNQAQHHVHHQSRVAGIGSHIRIEQSLASFDLFQLLLSFESSRLRAVLTELERDNSLDLKSRALIVR
jgi:hypothetical protein